MYEKIHYTYSKQVMIILLIIISVANLVRVCTSITNMQIFVKYVHTMYIQYMRLKYRDVIVRYNIVYSFRFLIHLVDLDYLFTNIKDKSVICFQMSLTHQTLIP